MPPNHTAPAGSAANSAPGGLLPRLLSVLALAGLYALGLYHWAYFFDHGRIDFTFQDWPKEYKYYTVLRDALRTGTLPLHVREAEYFHGTHRFLGLPETNLSPQILLLPWMDTGRFLLWNNWILYTAGFAGCLLLARRYRLSLVPFTLLFLLFNFNGSITAHLTMGHSMWCGHFLLPFYVLFLLELAEGDALPRPALLLSFALFALFLQGAFHHYVWGLMFLGLFVAFHPRSLRAGLLVVACSAALSCLRLAPAVLTFWGNRQRIFLSGYPTLTDLVQSFVTIRPIDSTTTGKVFWPLGWHEYDLYLGVVGFALFCLLGVGLRFSRDPALASSRFAEFDRPLLVLAALSFSDVYAFIARLPLPLLNGERVSSRFLIIPFVVLLLFGAVRLQRVLDRLPPGGRWLAQVVLAGLLVLTGYSLALHTATWSLAALNAGERTWPDAELTVTTIEMPDPLYRAVLLASAFVSLASLAAWLYCLRRPAALERWLSVGAASGPTGAPPHPDPIK